MTKKLTETSAGGRGERDIGSDAYADYTKDITPGQSAGTVPPANPSITSVDAKKADKKQKEDNAQKHRQATVVDDEFHPRVPMPVHEFLGIPFSAKARLARQQKKGAKIKTRTDLATAKMSNIAARDKLKQAKAKLRDMRTGGSVGGPVTAEYQPEAVTQAQLDKIKKHTPKGHLDMNDPSLPSRNSGNEMSAKQLAALHKLKQKVLGKDYDKPKKESVDRSPDKSGGKGVESPDEIMGVKVQKLKPSLKGMSKARRKVVKDRKEEVEIDEKSPYNKMRRDEVVPRRSGGQTEILRGKRRAHNTERGVKKVRGAKEETEMSPLMKATIDELSKKTLGSYVKKAAHDTAGAGIDLGVSSQKKGGQTTKDVHTHAGKLVKRQKGIGKAVDKLSQEDMSLAPKGKGRKAAKRMYGEDISIVDAVQEVLGLGNKWPGMEKMPPVDPKTGKMVTGKSKIQRLPKHKTVGAKGGPALSGYENKKEDTEVDEGSTKAGSYKKWAREGGRQRKHGGVSDPDEKGRDADSVYPDSVSVRAKSAGTAAHRRQRGMKKVRGAKEEVEMDEKNWIKGAIKNPGSLRKSLDVPAGENIPARKLASAAKEGGKMGRRARLAQTLKKMHNEFVPENGDHPPKKAHKHDKPEQGKLYALTGRSDQPSIARGDSWKKSVVTKKRKEQDAKK